MTFVPLISSFLLQGKVESSIEERRKKWIHRLVFPYGAKGDSPQEALPGGITCGSRRGRRRIFHVETAVLSKRPSVLFVYRRLAAGRCSSKRHKSRRRTSTNDCTARGGGVWEEPSGAPSSKRCAGFDDHICGRRRAAVLEQRYTGGQTDKLRADHSTNQGRSRYDSAVGTFAAGV